jgi:Acyclic terpene utilisation family protein AtuA
VTDVGPERVLIAGAKGSEPTTTYKATATVTDGFRTTATAMFSGMDAAGRARRCGHAIVKRTERLNAGAGLRPYDEVSVEVIGSGDTHGAAGRETATEVVLKVALRHPDKAALDRFSREWASMSLIAQGMTGFFGGRPRVAPVYRVLHLLVDKAKIDVSYVLDSAVAVELSVAGRDRDTGTPTIPAGPAAEPPHNGVSVPLRRLAYGRSGDKGDSVNIGIIAREPRFYDVILSQVTAERVRAYFAHYAPAGARAWERPGLRAVNVLLEGVLGGSGGTSTLRYDSQGKSYAAMLLELPVVVPAEFLTAVAEGAGDGS